MSYKKIFDLHAELLLIYEKDRTTPNPYQREINFYKSQYYIAQDIAQKIFVLNQLINLHEKSRAEQIKWCSEKYFENKD